MNLTFGSLCVCICSDSDCILPATPKKMNSRQEHPITPPNVSFVKSRSEEVSAAGSSPRTRTRETTHEEAGDIEQLPSTKSIGDASPANRPSALESNIVDGIQKKKQGEIRKKQYTYGTTAAAVAGGAGFLALGPIAAAGAAVAGAGAGWAYFSRKGEKDKQKVSEGDEMKHDKSVTAGMSAEQKKRAEFKRPSIKRLRFLTRWAKMEIEDDWEKNMFILDDIIMEFSPWVQELYLAAAHLTKSKSTSNQNKYAQCLLHLAPLYNFLQKTIVFDAFQMLNRRFAVKYDSGVFDDNPEPFRKRCCMVLPIVYV